MTLGLASTGLVMAACTAGSSGSTAPATPEVTRQPARQPLVAPTEPGRAPLGPVERTPQTLYLATRGGAMVLTAAQPDLYASADTVTLACDGTGVIMSASWNTEGAVLQPQSASTHQLCTDREISALEAKAWVSSNPAAIPPLFDGRLAEGGQRLEVIDTGSHQ